MGPDDYLIDKKYINKVDQKMYNAERKSARADGLNY
jgi:hypothetical protein